MKQLYIILLILLSISTNAQNVDLEYTLFDSSNGFVDDEISALYTDSNGTIWIGTYNNGIYTYANDEFIHYDQEENDFLTGRPSVFLEADNGDMWIGFYHEAYGGVMKFDGTTFTAEHTVSDQISIGRVVDLLINEEGNLCILECHNSYHPHTLNIIEQDTILSYYMGETEENPRGIGNMVQSSDDKIWIVGRPELYIYDDGEILGDSLLNVPFETFDATHLELDDEGNIWLARWDQNLTITDEQASYWTFFNTEAGQEDHQKVLPGRYIGPLYKDMAGNVWFLCKASGLALCRFGNGDLVNFFLAGNEEYLPPLDMDVDPTFSNPITEDTDQNLWIGLETLGLVRFENIAPEDIPEAEELPDLTTTFPVDLDNTPLKENSYGLYREYNNSNGFFNLEVTALYYDSQGRLWIGGEGKIYSFKNDTFTRYPFFSNDWYDYNQFNGDYIEITDFVEDSEGNIYIAVGDKHLGGIYQFDGEKISSLYVNGNESLAYRYTTSLLMDEDNTLYAATWALNWDWGDNYPDIYDTGVTIYESDTTRVFTGLGPGRIWDIEFHPDPSIKVGFLGEYYCELDESNNIAITEFDNTNSSQQLRALAYNVGEDEILIADDYWGFRSYDAINGWSIIGPGEVENIYSAYGKTWCSQGSAIKYFEDGNWTSINSLAPSVYKPAMVASSESILWLGGNYGLKKLYLTGEFGVSNENLQGDNSVMAYPNPVSDELFIDVKKQESYQYNLFDNVGRIVQMGKVINNRIDMTALSAGTYLLVLYSEYDCKHTRIIKK